MKTARMLCGDPASRASGIGHRRRRESAGGVRPEHAGLNAEIRRSSESVRRPVVLSAKVAIRTDSHNAASTLQQEVPLPTHRASLRRCLAAGMFTLTAAADGCVTAVPASAHDAPGHFDVGPRVIVSAQLGQLSVATAYEALQQLRPAPLSASQLQRMSVYLNRQPLANVRQLRSVPVQAVTEIRFLDPSEATKWLGNGHPSGAILVSTFP
jgi:hypothetical protein